MNFLIVQSVHVIIVHTAALILHNGIFWVHYKLSSILSICGIILITIISNFHFFLKKTNTSNGSELSQSITFKNTHYFNSVQQYLLTVLVLLVPEVCPKRSFVKDLSQTNQLLGELQHYKV